MRQDTSNYTYFLSFRGVYFSFIDKRLHQLIENRIVQKMIECHHHSIGGLGLSRLGESFMDHHNLCVSGNFTRWFMHNGYVCNLGRLEFFLKRVHTHQAGKMIVFTCAAEIDWDICTLLAENFGRCGSGRIYREDGTAASAIRFNLIYKVSRQALNWGYDFYS